MKELGLHVVAIVAFSVGVFFGYITGWTANGVVRSRQSLKNTRESIPILRKIFWGLVFTTAGRILLIAVALALLITWVRTTPPEAATTVPASVSPSPKER